MGQATNPTATSIRLDGMIGKILRWLWIAFAIMSLSLLVISIKPVYEDSLTICDGDDCVFLNASSEQVAQYEATGFSFEAVATSSIITVTISAIIFTIVAAIIFFSHPDELIALMTAFMLVGVGITGPIDYLQPDNIFWEIGLRILQLVAVVGLVGFLFTFPNGRFVPGWTGWIFILILLATFVYVILVILDFVSPDFSGLAPLMVVGILSQFYRYWRVAKPEERQQAKWVIASLVVFLLPVIILSIFSSPIVEIILNAGLGIAMLTSLPIAILVSIHKYGLWNIDFYINRGIVYLTLTIVLIIVFAGIFFVLQSLFNTVLGSGQIGLELIVPTAIVVALFNPVRIRLRHLVDRHLYGIKMDYTRIIESRQRLLAKADVSTTIGQYRTSKVIGSGGMGEVYAGQDKEGQQVAIKVLHHKYEQEEELEKRFLREARATAQLEHSHIVKILDVGDDNGRLFIAMEYIKGQDWGAILKAEGTQSLEQILTHLQELASALDYVHQNGIIHRDIKPGNIMRKSVV